jgi:hypothetical protein
MWGLDAVSVEVFAHIKHFAGQYLHLLFELFVLGLKLLLEGRSLVAYLDVHLSHFVEGRVGRRVLLNDFVQVHLMLLFLTVYQHA